MRALSLEPLYAGTSCTRELPTSGMSWANSYRINTTSGGVVLWVETTPTGGNIKWLHHFVVNHRHTFWDCARTEHLFPNMSHAFAMSRSPARTDMSFTASVSLDCPLTEHIRGKKQWELSPPQSTGILCYLQHLLTGECLWPVATCSVSTPHPWVLLPTPS